MLIELIQKNKIGLIFLIIGCMTVSAFCTRLQVCKKTKKYTTDEFVYYGMALQILEQGLPGYNTIRYGQELSEKGITLSRYFSDPLFKHPPVFTFLLVGSLKIFGSQIISAKYVSLLFGVLLIPLTFLLAKLLFDTPIALLSSAFMWFDPTNIMSSQKIWMDTTLSFFIVLSVYLFVYALKKQKNCFFILGGISVGFAVLTKYSGILAAVIILVYSAIREKWLYKNKYFLISLLIPFLVLIPWFYWNFYVFGNDFLLDQIKTHGILSPTYKADFRTYLLMALVIFFVVIIKFLFKKENVSKQKNERIDNSQTTAKPLSVIDHIRMIVIYCAGLWLIIALAPFIKNSLQLGHIPYTTWGQTWTDFVTPGFYFERLIEYSFIFVFSFASFFFYVSKSLDSKMILYFGIIIILSFLLIWESYQSRYILPAIPFLIILGTSFWMRLFQVVSKHSNTLIASSGRIILLLLLCYIFIKTYYLNIGLSYTNDMCYF